MTSDDEFAVFLRDQVGSVWAVELLLLLKRDPERSWSEAALVRELRGSAMLLEGSLARLERAGLVAREAGAARYAARGAPAVLADNLEAAYRERSTAVIRMLAKPASGAQDLSDAFRLKPRSDGDPV